MSYVATFGGRFKYREDEYRAVTDILEQDEDIGDPTVVGQRDEEGELWFFGTTRGLAHHIGIFAAAARRGDITYTSADVNWHGVILTASGTRVEVPLSDWYDTQEFAELYEPPNRGSFGSEGAYQDAYANWQGTVENLFHEVGAEGLDMARTVGTDTSSSMPDQSALHESDSS